jgi:hypothetical protein
VPSVLVRIVGVVNPVTVLVIARGRASLVVNLSLYDVPNSVSIRVRVLVVRDAVAVCIWSRLFSAAIVWIVGVRQAVAIGVFVVVGLAIAVGVLSTSLNNVWDAVVVRVPISVVWDSVIIRIIRALLRVWNAIVVGVRVSTILRPISIRIV